jgi:hypothetical protein
MSISMSMRAQLSLPVRTLVRNRTMLSLIAICVLASGCRKTYVDVGSNRLPKAVARAIDTSGMAVDSTVNNGLGPIYPFDGQPVEVKLDGTASSDMDGKIVEYRWLGTGLLDGGAGRVEPEGEEASWPGDVAQPSVKLDEGTWSFSLWVTDDEGSVSNPSEITLFVGDAPDAGPPKPMCMGKVCDPMVTLPGQTMPSLGCCDEDSGGACGAVVDMMGACEAVNQPGTDDPSCPAAMSSAGTMIVGCCKADKKCGVRSGVLRGCIERTDYPPGFLMSMMPLEAANCGN